MKRVTQGQLVLSPGNSLSKRNDLVNLTFKLDNASDDRLCIQLLKWWGVL